MVLDAIQDEMVFDVWSPLSFKRSIGGSRIGGRSWSEPTWVGDHARRLQAYKVRLAYAENVSRLYLQSTDQASIDNRREYGDSHLITETIMNAVIGEDHHIVVPGSKPDPDKTTQSPEQQAAEALEQHLLAWAEKEVFDERLIENERAASTLGDGVYTLGWSAMKGRTRLRVFDPGFYFPVLTDANDQDYPTRIHVAWELPPEPNDDFKKVHRITWELLPVAPYTVPWEDRPVEFECFMSEGIWRLDKEATSPDDFTSLSVRWLLDEDGNEIKQMPLGVDFIPVVHTPNTVAGCAHYGKGSLDYVLQIIDDIQATDTDLQAASATTGTPPLAVHGQVVGTHTRRPSRRPGADITEEVLLTYGPGEIIQTGEGGATLIDTSNSLTALTGYLKMLMERFEVNARTPGSFLGRVKPSEVPSGFAFALSFGPLRTMINEMRLVRRSKYKLLLKFVTRFELLGGNLELENIPPRPPELVFGGYLPADRAAAVTEVTQLRSQHAISRETGITILVEAGFPIEEARKELDRIAATDFAGAVQLANVVGEEIAGEQYLGYDLPEDFVPGGANGDTGEEPGAEPASSAGLPPSTR